jgi:hypothetical protein
MIVKNLEFVAEFVAPRDKFILECGSRAAAFQREACFPALLH